MLKLIRNKKNLFFLIPKLPSFEDGEFFYFKTLLSAKKYKINLPQTFIDWVAPPELINDKQLFLQTVCPYGTIAPLGAKCL